MSASAGALMTSCGSGGIGGNEFGPGGASAGTSMSGGANHPDSVGSGFTTSGTSSGGSGSGVGGGCAESSTKAELVPVNLFIMLDKSGSMQDNNKWPNVTQALISFFQDPATAGLRVALRFFPDNGCDDVTCDIQACSVPAVPIGPLTVDPAPADMQEGLLVSAVQARSPGGNTPMYAALAGAEGWAQAYAMAHPGERVAVLLATDGLPNGCDGDFNDIAQLAANNLNIGVVTYTVGFQGSNQAQLDQVAMAGGTKMAFMIGNGNTEQDLVNALKIIQGSQVPCSFAMPQPMPGMDIDPNKVNVTYTPGNGGPTQTLDEVANEAACGMKGGWYYDNAAMPTQIILCPSTCATVQADAKAKVEIVLGCQSQMIH